MVREIIVRLVETRRGMNERERKLRKSAIIYTVLYVPIHIFEP